MTVKELAQVFDSSTIFYIRNDKKYLDKKAAKHIERTEYCDKEVVYVERLETSMLIIIKE